MIKKSKKCIFNLIILICFSMILFPFINQCSSKNYSCQNPLAKNGIIDLKNWDFNKNGNLLLNGEWKYIWQENDESFSNKNYNDEKWSNFMVPNYWNKIVKTPFGLCWLRLKIININENNLGLFIKSGQTSYDIYVNDKKIMYNGKPGISREQTIPITIPQLSKLPDENEITIAWNIANFHNRYGGPRFSPIIGLYKNLEFKVWFSDVIESIILGFILMAAVYHLLLWIGRLKDKTNLYFSIICIIIMIRIIVTYQFLQKFFPDQNIFDIRLKIESLTALFGFVFFIKYLYTFYPEEISKKIINILNLLLFVSLAIIFIPIWKTTKFVYGYQIGMIILTIWIIISIIKAIINKREASKIILIGIIFLILTLINDIIYSNTPSFLSLYSIETGLVLFILIQSIILSLRFSKAFHVVEQFSVELQKEVDLKTKKIRLQYKKLKKASKEKINLFINIAHETKTPLTLITNYFDNYIKKFGLNEDLKIIYQNLNKFKRDMINFLDLEKLNQKKAFYNHDNIINFSNFLKQKIIMFNELAKNKKIEIYSKINDDIYIKIDPYALDRIINNLLDNSIRYTNERGSINIELFIANDKTKLIVSDTGIGIPYEKQKYIFKPYYQISHEKHNVQGLGVGLSIVKKIIDEINGKINLISEINNGTTFILYFNTFKLTSIDKSLESISFSNPISYNTNIKLKNENYSNTKPTILIVEDNINMLYYLQMNMIEDYNVFYAIVTYQNIDPLKITLLTPS